MLDVVLRHQFVTLMVFFATMAATGVLFVFIPKGFFPTQDTGLITGLSGGRAGRLAGRDEAAAAQSLAPFSRVIPTSRRSDRSSATAAATRSTPGASSSA